MTIFIGALTLWVMVWILAIGLMWRRAIMAPDYEKDEWVDDRYEIQAAYLTIYGLLWPIAIIYYSIRIIQRHRKEY